MAPPHLFLIQGEEGEFLEVLQNGCVLSAVLAVSPIRGGAGVWVNTECIEIHHRPWSATSCNLQSTLTLCEKPACLCCCYEAFCGDSVIWFDARVRVCVYGRICV